MKGDQDAFQRLTGQYRRELQLYLYRHGDPSRLVGLCRFLRFAKRLYRSVAAGFGMDR